MRDAPPFTREDIQLLESFVSAVLSRETTVQDVPRLRWALARQQALLETAYRVVGQHAQQIAALSAEVEALRRGWDQDDGRW